MIIVYKQFVMASIFMWCHFFKFLSVDSLIQRRNMNSGYFAANCSVLTKLNVFPLLNLLNPSVIVYILLNKTKKKCLRWVYVNKMFELMMSSMIQYKMSRWLNIIY